MKLETGESSVVVGGGRERGVQRKGREERKNGRKNRKARLAIHFFETFCLSETGLFFSAESCFLTRCLSLCLLVDSDAPRQRRGGRGAARGGAAGPPRPRASWKRGIVIVVGGGIGDSDGFRFARVGPRRRRGPQSRPVLRSSARAPRLPGPLGGATVRMMDEAAKGEEERESDQLTEQMQAHAFRFARLIIPSTFFKKKTAPTSRLSTS